MLRSLTFDVRGRRIGEAAKGTRKRSLWAVPLDGMVMHFYQPLIERNFACNDTERLPRPSPFGR